MMNRCLKKSLRVLLLSALLVSPVLASTQQAITLYTEQFAPFNMVNHAGNIVGSSTQVVKHLFTDIPYTIKLEAWSTAYQHTLNTPNTGLYSTVPTHQRNKLFKWVGPINQLSEKFVARKESHIDLRKFNAYLVGDYQHNFTINMLHAKGHTVKVFKNREAMLQGLATGAVDLILLSDVSAELSYAGLNPNDYQVVGDPFIQAPLYIAFNRLTSDALIRTLNNNLHKLNQAKH
jgi:polar amino acid transport system substrate-binding protein